MAEDPKIHLELLFHNILKYQLVNGNFTNGRMTIELTLSLERLVLLTTVLVTLLSLQVKIRQVRFIILILATTTSVLEILVL